MVVIGAESVVCTWEHAHLEHVYRAVLSPGGTAVFYSATDVMQSRTFVYSVDEPLLFIPLTRKLKMACRSWLKTEQIC